MYSPLHSTPPHITSPPPPSPPAVIDEEDKSITAGSIVTVSVFLTRTPMSAIINDSVEADTTTSTTVAAGDGDADDVNLEDNDDQYSANNFEEVITTISL